MTWLFPRNVQHRQLIQTQYSLLLFPDVGKCLQIFSLDSHRTASMPEGSHTRGKLLWFGVILTLFALHSDGGAWDSKKTQKLEV